MFSRLMEIGAEDWRWLLAALADILIVYYVIYRILVLLRGTKALRALMGLALITVLYFVSQFAGLVTTNWLLNGFFNSLIILVILVFHQDIRNALSRMGRAPFSQAVTTIEESRLVDEVVKAAVALSRKKCGGLIVLERNAKLQENTESAVMLDAVFTKELVQAILHTSSPIHDGAIVVRHSRISHAGVFLPLSTNPLLGRQMGTRHRAAIGVTEETDAVVVVTSEETGKISLAMDGKITRDLDADTLQKVLGNVMGRPEAPRKGRGKNQRRKETTTRTAAGGGTGNATQKTPLPPLREVISQTPTIAIPTLEPPVGMPSGEVVRPGAVSGTVRVAAKPADPDDVVH